MEALVNMICELAPEELVVHLEVDILLLMWVKVLGYLRYGGIGLPLQMKFHHASPAVAWHPSEVFS